MYLCYTYRAYIMLAHANVFFSMLQACNSSPDLVPFGVINEHSSHRLTVIMFISTSEYLCCVHLHQGILGSEWLHGIGVLAVRKKRKRAHCWHKLMTTWHYQGMNKNIVSTKWKPGNHTGNICLNTDSILSLFPNWLQKIPVEISLLVTTYMHWLSGWLFAWQIASRVCH